MKKSLVLCLSILHLAAVWSSEQACLASPVKPYQAGSVFAAQAEEIFKWAYENKEKDQTLVETKLLALLGILEHGDKTNPNIDLCLEALITSYQANDQTAFANECWEHRLHFVKKYQHRSYGDVLQSYLESLLNKNNFSRAEAIADQLIDVASQPDQTKSAAERPWRNYAEKQWLMGSREPNKLFTISYDIAITDSNLLHTNEYAATALHWARFLAGEKKRKEAIAVLERAIVFADSRPEQRRGTVCTTMIETCANLLREDNSPAEAEKFELKYRSQTEKQQISEETRKLDAYATTRADKESTKMSEIRALTGKAYHSLDKHNCEEGLKLIEQAVEYYEAHADDDKDGQMYDSFLDIQQRLTICGDLKLAHNLVWRLVSARMKTGMEDPAHPRYMSLCHGRVPSPRRADQEIFSVGPNKVATTFESNVQRMTSMADATHNPENIIYALFQQDRLARATHPDESRLKIYEQVEAARKIMPYPNRLVESEFAVAAELVRQNQFAEADAKWREAIQIKMTPASSDPSQIEMPTPYMVELGKAFTEKKQLENAKVILLEAYKMSTAENMNMQRGWIIKALDQLAWRYSAENSDLSAQSLMDSILSIPLGTTNGDLDQTIAVYKTKMRLFLANKKTDDAEIAYQKALQCTQTMTSAQLYGRAALMRDYQSMLEGANYQVKALKIKKEADKAEALAKVASEFKKPKPVSPTAKLMQLNLLLTKSNR